MCRRCCRNFNSNSSNNSNISNNSTMNSSNCNTFANNYTNSPFPENYLYGHAYTPNQNMNQTYNPECGLANGSIFPELVNPYSPGQSIDFIEFLRNGGMRNG